MVRFLSGTTFALRCSVVPLRRLAKPYPRDVVPDIAIATLNPALPALGYAMPLPSRAQLRYATARVGNALALLDLAAATPCLAAAARSGPNGAVALHAWLRWGLPLHRRTRTRLAIAEPRLAVAVPFDTLPKPHGTLRRRCYLISSQLNRP